MTVNINASLTQGLVLTSDTSGVVAFQSNNAETMRIDSSGNVGIGTTSPTARLDVYTNSAALSFIYGRNTLSTALYGADASGAGYAYVSSSTAGSSANMFVGTAAAANTVFVTNGSEKARVDSSGNLLVGKTTTAETTTGACFSTSINNIGLSSGNYFIINYVPGGSSTMIDFRTAGASKGSISQNGSNVAYNTSSDYRLKYNVEPLKTGLSTISALNPVTYQWIDSDINGEGFIAHELQSVIPLAVTGEKDAVDEEGNIKPQGVDYSKIVVHLVAAIKEQQSIISDLQSRIAALEAK